MKLGLWIGFWCGWFCTMLGAVHGCASNDNSIRSYVTPNKDDETILRCHREGRYIDGMGGTTKDSGIEAYAHYKACMKDGGL